MLSVHKWIGLLLYLSKNVFFTAFVGLFTLPKVYENNKAQIDQNIDLVRSKIAELSSKWVSFFCFISVF